MRHGGTRVLVWRAAVQGRLTGLGNGTIQLSAGKYSAVGEASRDAGSNVSRPFDLLGEPNALAWGLEKDCCTW